MSLNKKAREKLLNPKAGSQIAAARDYGIDLTQLAENLKLTPAQRIKNNDAALNSFIKFEEAVRKAKSLLKKNV